MDIEKIKEVVNNPFIPEEMKRSGILKEIARDKTAIGDILGILDHERSRSKELIVEMNVLLSQADVALDNKKLNKGDFIQAKVKTFYENWKDYVNHCFREYKKS